MTKQGSLWNDGDPGPGYIEAWARSRGHHPVLGVDEAGRGCLAGPVVAGALLLPDQHEIDGITDSKLLKSSQRESLFDLVREQALAWGVGVVESARIDEVGILPATLEAMALAVAAAEDRFDGRIGLVVVDGTATIPAVTLPQKSWAKGDRLSVNCAGASILAKVTRDRKMVEMESAYPGYGFARHMGYGTREHLAALQSLGPSPIHRMTFAPLKERARKRPR